MNAVDEFNRIAQRFPECNPNVESFPSGAAMLDLSIGGAGYCAQYLPSHNVFGLSKMEGSSPFWEGVDESFNSAEELEARIVELVKK